MKINDTTLQDVTPHSSKEINQYCERKLMGWAITNDQANRYQHVALQYHVTEDYLCLRVMGHKNLPFP